MKYYVAAILAFKDLKWADEGFSELDTGTYSECIPAIIPAESMEQAGELARQHLFERWKLEEGWHTHQANILPVSDDVYESIFTLDKANALEVDPSPGQTFNFE
jgi:hypothetical protein